MSSFFTDVSKVIFRSPGLAAVAGGLRELTDMIGINRDELHVPLDSSPLCVNAVRKIAHHAVFQPAFKVHAVGLAVDPILDPFFQTSVIVVEALARSASGPVFPESRTDQG